MDQRGIHGITLSDKLAIAAHRIDCNLTTDIMSCILKKLFNKIRDKALSSVAETATDDQKHDAIIAELNSNIDFGSDYKFDVSIDYVLGFKKFKNNTATQKFINKYFSDTSAAGGEDDNRFRASARQTYFTSGCPEFEDFAEYLVGLRRRRNISVRVPSMRFRFHNSSDENRLFIIDIIDSVNAFSDLIKYHLTIGTRQGYNIAGINYSNTYHLTDAISDTNMHTYYDLYNDEEIDINTRKVSEPATNESSGGFRRKSRRKIQRKTRRKLRKTQKIRRR
jgi:hypothetical protein